MDFIFWTIVILGVSVLISALLMTRAWPIGLVLAIAAIVALWVLIGLAGDQRAEECRAQGGRIEQQGRATLCLSDDGRVLTRNR